MKAIDIRVDHLKDPLGLQNRRPWISWCCDEGVRQSAYAYRILVNDVERYVSEKIESDEMSFVSPLSFKDRDRVEVKITLYNENGRKGKETSCFFEMGISFWEGKWIDPEPAHSKERQPASYLRKGFTLKRTGLSRLYISAHGLYEARINGKRVGEFVLAPGTDDYKKRIQYQIYDVKDLLREGENLIEVSIGDGWYRGNNGIDGTNHLFGDDLALICQLEVENEVIMVSDESWEASQEGPIRFSDMEIGEVYDAGKEQITDWHPVTARDYDKSILVCSDEVIVKEHEVFEGERIEVPNGEIVYKFPQNLAGYTCFEVDAKEGQKLIIWHGETLDLDGNFTQRNIEPGKRNRFGGIPQKIEYTCKEGKNIYKPSFSIFGFQYIKVETDIDLTDAKFEAIAVYSDMEETAKFECSNEDVNKLFSNCLWSMKSNFTDIPTDCPHRERSGWTGDAGVFVPTGTLLMDSYTVFRKWLVECRLGQKKNGVVANVNPPINKGNGGITAFMDGSTGWGDASIIVPYVLYKRYNDISILAENYDMMVKWLGYLQALAKKTSLANRFKKDLDRNYIIEKGFHWGEWCQPDVDSRAELTSNIRRAPKSATAYYFYSSRLLSEIASLLDKKEDAKKYKELSDRIRQAYIRKFTSDSLISSDRQCDYLRPIQFDLVDHKKENADRLNELIIRNGYHLNTGFLSTPFLCPVLCEYGHTDTAYKLLLQDSSPSWLYSVKKGSTTIWENWNGIEAGDNASLNHYSYGAVSGWLISGVCGIDVGLGKVTIKPCPNKALSYAKAQYKSPLGLISSAWKYNEDGIEFEFVIPANTEAEVRLPDDQTRILGYGRHRIELKGEF